MPLKFNNAPYLTMPLKSNNAPVTKPDFIAVNQSFITVP